MPIGWNVTMQLDCTNDEGETSRRNVLGQIMDWQDCVGARGVFKWSVRFRNGVEKLFEIDQLAELIYNSDRDGLNITGTLIQDTLLTT
ncbi:hypothetical protein PF005_g14567 [Phytophthora fragariae]|uniref:Uncharacterized protein n=1 Tax=Phytophthora fragariae TaxID=53985 RepID=A0A6A3INR5_9STRA|nr:hypothetical protein PF003_g38322 [Phytophthora fragariae]KAE8983710.1 hypothetical protein PF011_g21069 [Phytophthora fragariae]KAE9101928.1 hypothetical protein PF010_g14286 [Phytophthora fragariae]KAE9202411.1 hypothetical protein PF005_g14567 [Phytophthora fragariae]KAE9218677.1 hypothetical protein PF004_g13805 [Phytophthora fragariae]